MLKSKKGQPFYKDFWFWVKLLIFVCYIAINTIKLPAPGGERMPEGQGRGCFSALFYS